MTDLIEMFFDFFFIDSGYGDKKQLPKAVRFILFTLLCFLFIFFSARELFIRYDGLGEGTWFFVFMLILFIGLWLWGSYEILIGHKKKN